MEKIGGSSSISNSLQDGISTSAAQSLVQGNWDSSLERIWKLGEQAAALQM